MTFSTALHTSEGSVHVLTKARCLGLIPMPYTFVMRRGAADLKRLGIFIKWTTRDATMLATLHQAVIDLVQQTGVSGLVELGNSLRMTQYVAGAVGEDWHDIVKQAAQDGASFPLPDDILRYVKSLV